MVRCGCWTSTDHQEEVVHEMNYCISLVPGDTTQRSKPHFLRHVGGVKNRPFLEGRLLMSADRQLLLWWQNQWPHHFRYVLTARNQNSIYMRLARLVNKTLRLHMTINYRSMSTNWMKHVLSCFAQCRAKKFSRDQLYWSYWYCIFQLLRKLRVGPTCSQSFLHLQSFTLIPSKD